MDETTLYGNQSFEHRVDRVEVRLSHIEGTQLTVIHSVDEMRAEMATSLLK